MCSQLGYHNMSTSRKGEEDKVLCLLTGIVLSLIKEWDSDPF